MLTKAGRHWFDSIVGDATGKPFRVLDRSAASGPVTTRPMSDEDRARIDEMLRQKGVAKKMADNIHNAPAAASPPPQPTAAIGPTAQKLTYDLLKHELADGRDAAYIARKYAAREAHVKRLIGTYRAHEKRKEDGVSAAKRAPAKKGDSKKINELPAAFAALAHLTDSLAWEWVDIAIRDDCEITYTVKLPSRKTGS